MIQQFYMNRGELSWVGPIGQPTPVHPNLEIENIINMFEMMNAKIYYFYEYVEPMVS